MENRKIIRKTFLISAAYVGFGTLSLLGQSPKSIFYHDFFLYGFFITFPVNFLGFIAMFAERDNEWLALIIQFIVFLLFWRLLYSVFKN